VSKASSNLSHSGNKTGRLPAHSLKQESGLTPASDRSVAEDGCRKSFFELVHVDQQGYGDALLVDVGVSQHVAVAMHVLTLQKSDT